MGSAIARYREKCVLVDCDGASICRGEASHRRQLVPNVLQRGTWGDILHILAVSNYTPGTSEVGRDFGSARFI